MLSFKIQFPKKTGGVFFENKRPVAEPYALQDAAGGKTLQNRLMAFNALTGFSNVNEAGQSTRLQRLYTSKLNTLRFIAICSIVWGHSLVGWEGRKFSSVSGMFSQTVLLQLGRVGTINFFIISGFFLADKIYSYTIFTYLKHRFKRIILPWLIFVFACVCLQFFQVFTPAQLILVPASKTLAVAATLLSSSIFHAAYWFIPVSLISACLLIVLKKGINNWVFAAILATITLFYCLNLYYAWVSVNHTKSLLGYAFFMWLGMQLKQHIVYTDSLIARLSWQGLIAALLSTFILSCAEALHLSTIGCRDAFASIRITNIALSIVLLTIFLKNRSLYRIKKIKPQRYVYGVYLIHSLILIETMPGILQLLKRNTIFNNLPAMIILQCLFFGIIITLSYTLSVIIKKSRLKFLTGG